MDETPSGSTGGGHPDEVRAALWALSEDWWRLTVPDPFDPSVWFNDSLFEFPLWYRPGRPALTVGPIGRHMQQTQCRCGHDETQHIIVIGECLGGACDCTLLRLRTPVEAPRGWHERIVRAILDLAHWSRR